MIAQSFSIHQENRTMITLCGVPLSNYYNKLKLALLEKEVQFREERVAPSQDDTVLKRSPLGKVPFLITEHGSLSESQAILEYLEEAYPSHPLYPAGAYERAKCREFIQHAELNVELIARRIYKEALFGGIVSQETKDEVKQKVEVGLRGLNRLGSFAPYALGGVLSAADVVAWPHFRLVSMATERLYGEDLVAKHVPAFQVFRQAMDARPHVQRVAADWDAALTAVREKS
jgi:glutathione S-transferase